MHLFAVFLFSLAAFAGESVNVDPILRAKAADYVKSRVGERISSIQAMAEGNEGNAAKIRENSDKFQQHALILATAMGEIILGHKDASVDKNSLNADIDEFVYTMLPQKAGDPKEYSTQIDEVKKSVLASLPNRPDEEIIRKKVADFQGRIAIAADEYQRILHSAKVSVTPSAVPEPVHQRKDDIVVKVDSGKIPSHLLDYITRLDIVGYAASQELGIKYFIKRYIDDCIFCEKTIAIHQVEYCLSNRFMGAAGLARAKSAPSYDAGKIKELVRDTLMPTDDPVIRLDDVNFTIKSHFAHISDALFVAPQGK